MTMTPAEKLIHKSILDRCDKENIRRDTALDVADQAVQKYKNNQFTKASKLVDEALTKAKSFTKKKVR